MASNTYRTNLVIQGAPIPSAFEGTPQEFFEAMLARMQIYSPFGFTSFIIGSSKPSYNQGPWLKDGTKWYVWDDDIADYKPLDISDSENPYWFQSEEPTDTSPPLWFKLSGDNSAVEGVYAYSGGRWRAIYGASGPTADRPASPSPFERFFDTDIATEIWYERGQWRTTSGGRGDVKFVTWPTREQALLRNPGWEVLGTGETEDISWRGRVIIPATADQGGAEPLQTGASIATKAAASMNAGAETVVLAQSELPLHTHTGFSYSRTGQNNNNFDRTPVTSLGGLDSLYHSDDGHSANQATTAVRDGELRMDPSGGSSAAHNNMMPALHLWCLRKT